MVETPGSIRRASPGDVDAIRSLTRAAYGKWIAVIGREPFPMTADYDRAVKDHWIDVLERDGMLVALVEMIPQGDHLFIENLAVEVTSQGQGLGLRMLAHAEEEAQKAGLPAVQLSTNKAFIANIGFYERRGYQVVEARPLFDGGTMIVMRKPLALAPSGV